MKFWSLIEGLRFHTHIIKNGLLPNTFTSNQLISFYSKHGLLQEAMNLFDEMSERNVFTWNAILFAHINNHKLSVARLLFDSAPLKDSVTYNSMISGYSNSLGFETHAIQIFSKMQESGVKTDEFTLTTMLNLTAKISVLSYGIQLHCHMIKTANDLNGFAMSSLIDMYSKCDSFGDAIRVFSGSDEEIDLVSKNAMVAACCRKGEMDRALDLFRRNLEVNDTVSWNTIIAGYVQNSCEEKGLNLFVEMGENGIGWNEHTFATVLSCCSSLRNQKHGRSVHGWVLKNGLSSNPYINSGIVDMYCKCENLRYAESVRELMGAENPFSITSLIVGYSSQGKMDEARRLFDSLTEKNSVVWTALFSGYVRSKKFESVFDLFREFRDTEKFIRDPLIFISVLQASSIQAKLRTGEQIHTYILRNGIEMEDKLSSSVVDMYAKCGEIKYAEAIFRQVASRDRVLYNAMMAGYANHGYEKEAILLFEEMIKMGVEPDEITFIALLSACRHAGLVEIGERYFHSMSKEYGLSPEIDHYSCMVDLYGRGNCLEKAVDLMRKIPVELDAVIWGAFLNACRINGNVKLARKAEEELLKMEANNGARYVQLANVYAAKGEWSDMSRIRKKMRGGEVQKLAGCSWVYVENKISIFTSGDRSHSQSETIYSTLSFLNAELKEGNRPAKT